MEIILAWISVVLGVAGLSYGIYQNKLKERVERLATLQAWEVYQSAYQAVGWLNNAFEEKDETKKQCTFAEAKARAESHYSKTIHNLYTHHDLVTPHLVDKWISEGRIKEHAKRDFLRQIGEK